MSSAAGSHPTAIGRCVLCGTRHAVSPGRHPTENRYEWPPCPTCGGQLRYATTAEDRKRLHHRFFWRGATMPPPAGTTCAVCDKTLEEGPHA